MRFPVPRIMVDGLLEPDQLPCDGKTAFAGAIVDSGAPFVIVPHKVHSAAPIRIYQDFGMEPYGLFTAPGGPLLQRFVEVGLAFLVPGSPPSYRPANFVRVKAYLVDDQTPLDYHLVI